jgi:MFS family permease
VMGKTRRFFYGWVIVAVSFSTLFFTHGIRNSFGVFYVAMLQEYGWGRGETAGAFSLALVIHASFALVTGALIDRFGPRRLFPVGATFLAMGLAIASRIGAICHLYLFFGVVIAIGINTMAYAPHMSLIPKWFIRRRGFASGLVMAGMGVGILVMAPVIQLMIDTVGWRFAFLILGGLVLCILVPMTALFQRRSPADVGQFPDGIVPGSHGIRAVEAEGERENTPSHPLSEQWTLRSSLHTRAFWWMTLPNISTGFAVNMLVVHQAAHVVDAGYSPGLAAFLVGLVGLSRSTGSILCGFISDRMGRETAFTIGGSAAVAGIAFLLLVRDTTAPWMLYAFVALFGFGSGSSGPIGAAAIADLFPGNSLGRILGTSAMAWGIGGALGAYLGGYFHDQVGSYTFPFLLTLTSISLGVLGIWMAAPRRRNPRGPITQPIA